MSYLMFQNMLNQQKKESEAFAQAFNKKQESSHIIGRLCIDNEIIPITNIKYEKFNKKIEEGRGFYYVDDGYKVIIDVLFSKPLLSKHLLNYVVIKLKDDKELEKIKSQIKNNKIINYEDYRRNQDG